MEMAMTQLVTVVAHAVSSSPEDVTESSGSRGRTAFQWGGTISALFLLIMNRIGRRSSMQYTLLVVYLVISFPTVLFKILRGQFGCWVALLAVAANLSFPDIFPVSRFLLFVITPDWVADGLRDSIVGGVFSLIVAILLVVMEIRGIGGFANWECNSHCCGYCLGQPYIRKATTLCGSTENSTSVFGYTCNGLNRTCQAYLTFRSQFPYNTVSSISHLLGSDPSQLSHLNSVSANATFETDKAVLIPVNCSCSGQYYQANTSYVIEHKDTFFLIANNTFQGLSTCQALQAQNSNRTTRNLYSGTRITVPLRCACPTKDQIDVGVNYLLSYLVATTQYVSLISSMFGVDTGRTLEANQLSEQDPTIYPFTTLLVPLENPPSSSQTIAPPPPLPPPSPPPPPSLPSSNNSSNKTWVYLLIGALGGGGLVLVIGAIVFCIFFHKNKKKADPIIVSEGFEAIKKQSEKKLEEESKEFLASIPIIAQSLKVYSFEELQSATEYFSPNCWIKGSVYRGTINGDFVAIKEMNGDVSKEINLLNKISHSSLIRLSGVCFSEGHWYFVYEYAINGPLSDWIYHNNTDQKFLNWTQRMHIALDVAMGLNYIHNYTSPPYVHKDIKSSNVLLDSDFRAKIAKFGLARSADGQEGEFALTRHIVGTKGYMAPEYLENGFISTKLDVYAFGVLMLEILTGKEVFKLYQGVDVHLSEVLSAVLNEENGKENLNGFIDPSLQGNYPAELALFVARLVDSCIKRDPSDRPGMDEIETPLLTAITPMKQGHLRPFFTPATAKGCPATHFSSSDLKFLMFHKRFNVSARSVAYANGFSEEDQTIYTFTTILIPLPTAPLSSQTIIHDPPAIPPPPPPITRNRKSKKGLIVGIATGLSVMVLLFFVLFVGFLQHNRNKVHVVAWKDREGKKKKEVLTKDVLVGIARVEQVLKVYKFKELEAATENFSHENRLRDSVYRGLLHGKVFAIKKMSTDVSKEVKILNKINHANLIGLYGACEHHGVFYLLYEFMENGSLKDWLHKNSSPELQSWSRRIQIALDVANGLHYLHNFTDPAYVHKDINSSNVLLSRYLKAKIANFSLAKSAEQGESSNSSTMCALRARCHMAPEYLEAGMVTPMMDVYAFGVVLLELITGREAVFEQDGEEVLLFRNSSVDHGWRKFRTRVWKSNRPSSTRKAPAWLHHRSV
ncbi:hypothetical protein TEA_015921 [Camellia sinensis var. sinensis]|uniref:Protein kinase domain-containing protein n=1 Tax=Camellia sinensis var. sinensis TaxID=542762 RepID=A0A4S4DYN4_CAMSN|nr:hypothetical protein TEA_015921 [Camellia sinensis var. sinensis]